MKELQARINACTECAAHLPHGCRPVYSITESSIFTLIGQAPGRIVHESGIPWQDKSGDRLREWMGVDEKTFYDASICAIVPMGFCYPGSGKSGDLPPRPECAPLWHPEIFAAMADSNLTLLIGQYAQKYYLNEKRKKNLTETVRSFADYLPRYFPLPHPSPRNNIWQKKNPWFQQDVLPELSRLIAEGLGSKL